MFRDFFVAVLALGPNFLHEIDHALMQFNLEFSQGFSLARTANAEAGERVINRTVGLTEKMFSVPAEKSVFRVIQIHSDVPAGVFIGHKFSGKSRNKTVPLLSAGFIAELSRHSFAQLRLLRDLNSFHNSIKSPLGWPQKQKSPLESLSPLGDDDRMKAVQLLSHGTPGRFVGREIPEPVPLAREVVVRVGACGVNRLDLWAEEGALPVKLELPRILGCEMAGEILALGKDVSTWQVGDRVAVQSNLSCGECEFCARDRESICVKGQILGVNRDGGFAEQVLVPETALVALPDSVSFETSAALTLAGTTAMHMLTSRANVRSGDWVLVIGGASGVGSAAIQIAKSLGAYVIATGSTEAKRVFGKRLGADHAVDSTLDTWPAEVRKITGKRGVDLVVEHVGGNVLLQAMESLARGGTIVTCGATAGREVQIKLWSLFVKEQSIVGSSGRNRADFEATLQWAEQERLKPVIDEIYPLADTAKALGRLRTRTVMGKLVVCP